MFCLAFPYVLLQVVSTHVNNYKVNQLSIFVTLTIQTLQVLVYVLIKSQFSETRGDQGTQK